MAVVADTIAMVPTYLPYERFPDPQMLWSAVPRGLRGFIVDDVAISAKPNGDQQTLLLTGTMPIGFAYVFSEINLMVDQDVAAAWSDRYSVTLTGFHQGVLEMSWKFAFAVQGIFPQVRKANADLSTDQLPRAPMWSRVAGSGIGIKIQSFNSGVPVGTAGTCSAYISFWEFDLEQARKFPLNSPMPVHIR